MNWADPVADVTFTDATNLLASLPWVTHIRQYVFCQCHSLAALEIPVSEVIDNGAIYDMHGLYILVFLVL